MIPWDRSGRSTFFTSSTHATYCRDRTNEEKTIHVSIQHHMMHTNKVPSAVGFVCPHRDRSSHETLSPRPNCEPCDHETAQSEGGVMSPLTHLHDDAVTCLGGTSSWRVVDICCATASDPPTLGLPRPLSHEPPNQTHDHSWRCSRCQHRWPSFRP